MPDSSELRLSSAFIHEGASQKFEWTATVLNINVDRNEKLLKSCKALEEYSIFFDIIRYYIIDRVMDKEKAIAEAIDECVKRGFILSDYLLIHRAEVVGVLLTEYNEQETMAMFKRDYEAELAKERQKTAEAEAETAKAKAAEEKAKAEAAKVKAKAENDKIKTVKQMKADGLSVEAIMRYTGFTAEEIEAI